MDEVPIVLLMGGYAVCTPDWWNGHGTEDGHRFYFPRSGWAEVIAGETVTVIEPGNAYLIPGYRSIQHYCRPRLELDWLHFRIQNPVVEAVLVQHGPSHWGPTELASWRPLYRRMAEIFQDRSTKLTQQMRAMVLYHVAAMIGDAMDASHHAKTDAMLNRLRPAVEYMDKHYLDNPPLNEIARVAHLSPTYFHRRFVEWFRVTPHTYMLQRRMRQAHHLLERGHLDVSEVAAACGYPNVFYFSRTFKRYAGYSPREARRRSAVHRP